MNSHAVKKAASAMTTIDNREQQSATKTHKEITTMIRGYNIKPGADLRSADLRCANLRYAYLRYADLHYADLSSANLSSANLHGANLRYANLSSANLRSADLHGADLRYADLSSAKGNEYTRLPAGWKVEDGLVVLVKEPAPEPVVNNGGVIIQLREIIASIEKTIEDLS